MKGIGKAFVWLILSALFLAFAHQAVDSFIAIAREPAKSPSALAWSVQECGTSLAIAFVALAVMCWRAHSYRVAAWLILLPASAFLLTMRYPMPLVSIPGFGSAVSAKHFMDGICGFGILLFLSIAVRFKYFYPSKASRAGMRWAD